MTELLYKSDFSDTIFELKEVHNFLTIATLKMGLKPHELHKLDMTFDEFERDIASKAKGMQISTVMKLIEKLKRNSSMIKEAETQTPKDDLRHELESLWKENKALRSENRGLKVEAKSAIKERQEIEERLISLQ